MSLMFNKNQIVSSTDLVRSFSRYLEKDLNEHDILIFKHNAPEAVLIAYNRYEQLIEKFDKLKDLFEHIAIYEIIEKRKDSPEKEISIEKLEKEYGL